MDLNLRRKLVRVIFGRADASSSNTISRQTIKRVSAITGCIFELFFGRRQK